MITFHKYKTAYSKHKYAQKTSKKKSYLFAYLRFVLWYFLVLLVKTKSLNGLKKLVFMSLPVSLN